MNNNYLRYAIIVGLFAVPFIPLYISEGLFFPFITGKAFAFRTIIQIISVCYLILAFRQPEYRPTWSWISKSLLIFLVAIGIADIFAINPTKAFWSNYERMEGFLGLLHLGAYFLVMSSILKTKEIWNKLLATSLLASVIMAIYSFLQLAGKITINQGGVRVDGTLGNAGYLGLYAVFHVFFAALLFVRSRETWQKTLLSIVGILNIAVLYYTATRGAILGFLIGGATTFLVLLFKSKKGDKIRKIGLIGLIALVAVVSAFFAARDTDFVKESPVLRRFASISLKEAQEQGRYYIWPMAWKGFLERPILGWGQEGFNFVFNKHYNSAMYNQEAWFDRAHNTYLDWLIAGGAVGLLAYLLLIGSLLKYVFRAGDEFLKNEEQALVVGLVTSYLFYNLFSFDQISSYILFFILLSYVHSHIRESKNGVFERVGNKVAGFLHSEDWKGVVESTVVIVGIIVFVFTIVLPMRRNLAIIEVLRSMDAPLPIEKYRSLLKSEKSLGFPEALEYVSQSSINIAFNQQVDVNLKQELFTITEEAFEKQLSVAPSDARYRMFYANFLSQYGWYGRAIEQYGIARDLSPRKQAFYFGLVNNLLLDKKYPEALAAAKTAYELEPAFAEAKMVYALTAIANGDQKLSDELLSTINEESLIFDDRYLGMLANFKQHDRTIRIAQRRVELRPNDPQQLMTLAGAYLDAGRRAETIATIRKMIELEPSFKEQGEYFISEIQAGRNP